MKREQKPKPEQTGDPILDATPDQIIQLVKESFPGKDAREIKSILVEIHDRYNERYEPYEFHKPKWKLQTHEIENMLVITQEVLSEIPDKEPSQR